MPPPRHRQGHIAQCLGRILACRGGATAAVAAGPGGRRLSGAEFVNGVRSLAAGLADRGVRPGHVVAAVALNSVEYVQLFLAVTYAGAIIAPLNYRWSFEEAARAVELVQPSAFAFDGVFSSWALRLMEGDRFPSIGLYLLLGDPACRTGRAAAAVPIADIMGSLSGATAAAAAAMEPVSAPEDVALICFTSGTTGRPKGVAISHTSLIVQSLAKIAIVGYGEDDVYLHTAPLCHIGGISSCMAVLMAGGRHVLAPKFDARSAFAAIQEHGVTCFITVPAIMADLLSYARKEETVPDCGKTVTKILNGGGGLSLDLVNAASQSFPRAAIFSAYGMTEACSSLTFMALNTPKRQEPAETQQPGGGHYGGVCVGRPAPHVEIRIDVDGTGSSPPTGNVLTRGLHTMVGYWANGKADSSECDRNGWIDTGDTGWVDEEGNLWLLGRHKGRIKTGGENVYPEEVESVLSQHPGVARAVVVGVPDSRLGERVVACVSVKDGWNWVDARTEHRGEGKQVSPQILHDHCRTKGLSRFKVPRSYYQRRQPFPVTTTGKIRREELKRELLAAIRLPSNL